MNMTNSYNRKIKSQNWNKSNAIMKWLKLKIRQDIIMKKKYNIKIKNKIKITIMKNVNIL